MPNEEARQTPVFEYFGWRSVSESRKCRRQDDGAVRGDYSRLIDCRSGSSFPGPRAYSMVSSDIVKWVDSQPLHSGDQGCAADAKTCGGAVCPPHLSFALG